MLAFFLLSAAASGQMNPAARYGEQTEVIEPPAAIVVEIPLPPPPEAPPQAAKSAPAPADRQALMEALQGTWYGTVLDDNRISVTGWESMSFTGSTDRQNQLPMGFNYLANQFALQQSWLRIDKSIDPTALTPTWGFRSDTILPGLDYRFTLPRGLFNNQLTADNGTPSQYGIDPVQFYLEGYLPDVGDGLDLKLGRFFAIFGAESIDTTQNAVYSRAYNFLYNPYTHTGLLATQKLTDAWTVQNGLVTGSDIFVGPGTNPTYIGSVKWGPPNGRDSFLFSVILGRGQFDVEHNFSNPELFDIVYTHRVSDRLTYMLDATYSFQTNVPNFGFANNWGIVQYLTYQIAPRLTGTGRLEFFDDAQGQRTGYKGLYTAITGSVTYQVTSYLRLRPELRFDNNSQSAPFEGKPNLFTATMNILIRW